MDRGGLRRMPPSNRVALAKKYVLKRTSGTKNPTFHKKILLPDSDEKDVCRIEPEPTCSFTSTPFMQTEISEGDQFTIEKSLNDQSRKILAMQEEINKLRAGKNEMAMKVSRLRRENSLLTDEVKSLKQTHSCCHEPIRNLESAEAEEMQTPSDTEKDPMVLRKFLQCANKKVDSLQSTCRKLYAQCNSEKKKCDVLKRQYEDLNLRFENFQKASRQRKWVTDKKIEELEACTDSVPNRKFPLFKADDVIDAANMMGMTVYKFCNVTDFLNARCNSRAVFPCRTAINQARRKRRRDETTTITSTEDSSFTSRNTPIMSETATTIVKTEPEDDLIDFDAPDLSNL